MAEPVLGDLPARGEPDAALLLHVTDNAVERGDTAGPADHAQVMLFLASDGAAYLNGTVQDVNGGRVMM